MHGMASIRSGIGENMDRYLYKAKRLDNGEWVTGSLLTCEDGTCKIATSLLEVKTNGPILVCAYDVDRDTICQCIGLKDKNGNLIWENDIASYSDLITRDKKTICIKWNKIQASFVRKYRSPMGLQYLYLDEYIASRMEVIGNIFDNPELLESEE